MNEKELRKLNKMAWELYGCGFDDLDIEDQDTLYCMMMEDEQI